MVFVLVSADAPHAARDRASDAAQRRERSFFMGMTSFVMSYEMGRGCVRLCCCGPIIPGQPKENLKKKEIFLLSWF